MKKVLLATVAVLAISPALATDLSIPAPVFTKALVGFNWTTCYATMLAGANTGTQQTGAPVAGGLIGCNYAFNGILVGFEGDADATKASVAPAPGTVDIKALANASLRLGYPLRLPLSFGPFSVTDEMLYIKVGVPADYLVPTSTFVGGWGAAAGLEYVIRPCTTSRLEYRYDDIGGVKSHKFLTGISLYYCG
jgi:opacity protein-like surface antigen